MDKKIIAFGNSELRTNFHDHRIPKEGSHCVCLSVILRFSS